MVVLTWSDEGNCGVCDYYVGCGVWEGKGWGLGMKIGIPWHHQSPRLRLIVLLLDKGPRQTGFPDELSGRGQSASADGGGGSG